MPQTIKPLLPQAQTSPEKAVNKPIPVKPLRRLAPEIKRILDGLSPVLDDVPDEAELAALEALSEISGSKLTGILRAKVINAE